MCMKKTRLKWIAMCVAFAGCILCAVPVEAAVVVGSAVKAEEIKYEQVYEAIPYETVYEYREGLLEEVVLQTGVEGVQESIYKVRYMNGDEQERELLSYKVFVSALEEVILTPEKEEVFIYPVSGVFTSAYGFRDGAYHEGIDLANDEGTEVISAMSGTVVRAEWYYGYGLCVDIEHEDGYWTRYGHLSEIDVEIGQEVEQGECIGRLGNTGRSTGPHVHFEIRSGAWPLGKSTDPLPVLEQGLE